MYNFIDWTAIESSVFNFESKIEKEKLNNTSSEDVL